MSGVRRRPRDDLDCCGDSRKRAGGRPPGGAPVWLFAETARDPHGPTGDRRARGEPRRTGSEPANERARSGRESKFSRKELAVSTAARSNASVGAGGAIHRLPHTAVPPDTNRDHSSAAELRRLGRARQDAGRDRVPCVRSPGTGASEHARIAGLLRRCGPTNPHDHARASQGSLQAKSSSALAGLRRGAARGHLF